MIFTMNTNEQAGWRKCDGKLMLTLQRYSCVCCVHLTFASLGCMCNVRVCVNWQEKFIRRYIYGKKSINPFRYQSRQQTAFQQIITSTQLASTIPRGSSSIFSRAVTVILSDNAYSVGPVCFIASHKPQVANTSSFECCFKLNPTVFSFNTLFSHGYNLLPTDLSLRDVSLQ